jgi:hypothetical protein
MSFSVAPALSVLTFGSVHAATWAQDAYLREQAMLVSRVKERLALEAGEELALEAYGRTMVGNRTGASGRFMGARVHALVKITPLILPMGFSFLWLHAHLRAPGAGP